MMFQVLFFFHKFLQFFLQKSFQFIFLFSIILQKLEQSGLSALSLYEIMKKNDAWNIRCLVDESFVP
jgi:hypothetical protein